MDAVTSLRQEFPALGLTAGFADPKSRAVYADLMLLWLEINRARSSQESLIAAARLTWWRDAIADQKPEGVPLAIRLLANQNLDHSKLSATLTECISHTLNGAGEDHIHLSFGDILSATMGGDAKAAGQVMMRLKASLSGYNTETSADEIGAAIKTLPKPLRLIDWLADDPRRLHYPETKPMLALSMVFAAIRL